MEEMNCIGMYCIITICNHVTPPYLSKCVTVRQILPVSK